MSLFAFQQQFPDEASCLAFLETQRWGENGENRYCPHCGSLKSYRFTDGKLFKCGDCRKKFTVKVGTMFSDSHVPLQKWFYAIYLNTSLKKGISSIQLAKYLGITQKSAWFMLQRIRYSVETAGRGDLLSNIVEADETYVGGKRHDGMRGRGASGKTPVVGIAERKGEIRLEVTENTKAVTLDKIITDHVAPGSTVMTDEYRPYNHVTKLGYEHRRVNHSSKDFVIDENHTNTIEGAWSHLKLSIQAIYIGVSPKHLQKYCAEYEYRYNTRGLKDDERFNKWFGFVNGVNLTYKKLIGTGQLVPALAVTAPTQTSVPEISSSAGHDRLAKYRKHRARPGNDDL
jgi:transposase-like protein